MIGRPGIQDQPDLHCNCLKKQKNQKRQKTNTTFKKLGFCFEKESFHIRDIFMTKKTGKNNTDCVLGDVRN